MPYDTVHLLVKITWHFSRDTVLSQQKCSVLFKPHISCVIWDDCLTFICLCGVILYTVTARSLHDDVELEVLDANMFTFCSLMEVKALCLVCFHGQIPEAGGRVLEGGLQSGSGWMKKRRGNFYLVHFSVRTLWTADSSNTVLFVLAVCLHNHNNSGVCSCVSSYQNTFSSLPLAYKYDACHPVCFCASGQQ